MSSTDLMEIELMEDVRNSQYKNCRAIVASSTTTELPFPDVKLGIRRFSICIKNESCKDCNPPLRAQIF